MTELNRLYQHMILEHNKHPRNFQQVDPYTHHSHGHNPLCGDDYKVFIRLKDNNIEEIGFIGEGCAISKASGSLMTQAVKGKTVKEVVQLKDKFINLLTKDEEKETDLGKLNVFEGVKKFPVRVKCATLVWRALEDALDNTKTEHIITTE